MFLLIPACALFMGCGPGGPRTYDITGTVSYEGEPVSNGEILFEPTDKSIAPDGAPLIDGKYKARVKEGPHTVRIRASKKYDLPPGKTNAMGEPYEFKSYLPAKFNDKSDMTIDVQKSQTLNYELKGK